MKKMRRMIPALCMLLVSAIMLSTASYAWFTINNQVTATGMQIQAQAAGSLVISSHELKYNDTNDKADFSDDAITHLTPITLVQTEGMDTEETDDDVYEWQKPEEGAVVHPHTGKLTYGGLEKVDTPSENLDYLDKTVYIGTSGDEDITSGTMQIDLSAIASAAGEATNAYSIAVYVIGVVSGTKDELVDAALNRTPDAIVHVDTNVPNRNTATINLDANNNYIPSIVGIGADNNGKVTGLKVVLRLYVDGMLPAEEGTTIEAPTGTYTYTKVEKNTKYNEGISYYIATGKYVLVSDDEMKAAIDKMAPEGWLIKKYDATEDANVNPDKTYYKLGEETGEYTVVDEPTDGDIGDYYELTYVAPTDDAKNVTVDEDGNITSKFYVKEYVPADLNNLTENDAGETVVPEGWYFRTENTDKYHYNYVRTEDVPSSGSTLAIKFTTVPAAN